MYAYVCAAYVPFYKLRAVKVAQNMGDEDLAEYNIDDHDDEQGAHSEDRLASMNVAPQVYNFANLSFVHIMF